MPECIHDMDPDWCSICKHGLAQRPEVVAIETTFRARYDGQCPGCNLPIMVGQVVHRLSNETYVHQGCQP